jgi:hypothetical protein
MARTVWVALICLITVSVLFAVRTGIVGRAIAMGTASLADVESAPAIHQEPPLAKADRLPLHQLPAATPETVASPPEAVVSPPETASPPEAATSPVEVASTPAPEKIRPPTASVRESKKESHEVSSWHWHAGAKITKRTTAVRER